MTARLPELHRLTVADMCAASARILAHPTSNAQRVSLDETYTFALWALASVQALAAVERLLGPVPPGYVPEPDEVAARAAMAGCGFGQPTIPTAQQEPARG